MSTFDKNQGSKDDKHYDEMPDRLRSLLHRPFDFISDPRHARWQAGRNALSTIDRRRPLPDFRQRPATGSLQQPAG
jgi:hypothetical protein